MRAMRLTFERALVLAALALGGMLLYLALKRAAFAQICSMTCAPFGLPEYAAEQRRAMDWRTPLTLAFPALAFVSGWAVGRGLLGRRLARR